MGFKKHPIFDRSQASDWFDLSDDLAPLRPEMEPFARLIQVYRNQKEHLERKVLGRIKRHVGEEDLASKPHIMRNEVLFAPLGDHGFQVYFQFYFVEHMDRASADSDFWWGIIFCPHVLDQRFGLADIRHWNVVYFGWSAE
jgi:hypothetical protein